MPIDASFATGFIPVVYGPLHYTGYISGWSQRVQRVVFNRMKPLASLGLERVEKSV